MTDIIQAKKIAPQGYHYTNAGILPNEWTSRPLSSIVEEITETAGTRKIETVSISAGVGFVNQAEKFGKELSGKQYEKYTVLHQGDFSYNKGNSNLYPQGCIYRLNDRAEAAVPNVFESFRVSDGDPDYYEQLFISGFLNHQLYSRINRGVRDDGLLNLTGKDFYSCEVPCPPLSEQRRIAEILLQYDRILLLYRNEIRELQKLKNAYFKLLFPLPGKKVPSVRFQGYIKPWKLYKLEDITSKIGSGKTPQGGRRAYHSAGIPLIRSQNVLNGRVDLTDVVYIDSSINKEMENSSVRYGDVLLNITGASIGRSAVYKEKSNANVNQHVCIIRPNGNVSSEFLQIHLSSYNGQKQIVLNQAGGGRQGLNFQHIGKMEFLFPSKEEQNCIADFFESINQLIYNKTCILEYAQRKKKALAKLLIIGAVRVKV